MSVEARGDIGRLSRMAAGLRQTRCINGYVAQAALPIFQRHKVSLAGSNRNRFGERLVVRVRARHPRATPSIAVLFSGDDGATWLPVGFDPPDGELSVEAERLPGGEHCHFRAIAGAELQSAVADTEAFEMRPATRRLYVVTPSGECGIPPGPVALSALIDTRGWGAVAPHEIARPDRVNVIARDPASVADGGMRDFDFGMQAIRAIDGGDPMLQTGEDAFVAPRHAFINRVHRTILSPVSPAGK